MLPKALLLPKVLFKISLKKPSEVEKSDFVVPKVVVQKNGIIMQLIYAGRNLC